MKKVDLGQAIQILANVGVIVGIVFLAIQLHQNNELVGMQIRTNSLNRIVGTADLVLENPHLLELLHKDPSALTPMERDTLVVLGLRNLSNFEIAYRDTQRGLDDEELLMRRIRVIWNRPNLNYAMPLAWPTFRERASAEFVAWMEQNVVGDGAAEAAPEPASSGVSPARH